MTQDEHTASLSRAMSRLQLDEPWAALLCTPARYLDITNPKSVVDRGADAPAGIYQLRVDSMRTFHARQGRWINGFAWGAKWIDIGLSDGSAAQMKLRVFGPFAPWAEVETGQDVVLQARAKGNDLGFGLELEAATLVPRPFWGRVQPIYLGIAGVVSGAAVEALVERALTLPDAPRRCATRVLQHLAGLDMGQALRRVGKDGEFADLEELVLALHRPRDLLQAQSARETARALSALAVQCAALQTNVRSPHAQSALDVRAADALELARTQPESLTADQTSAVTAIAQGFMAARPTTALLNGDVGTGKTLTYLLPLVAAHLRGARCAIMAPTQTLADQIHAQIQHRFHASGATAQRIMAGDKRLDPRAILVGTSGLVSVAKKCGYQPNVFVCDEQHKLGAASREALVAPWTHLIEVSATPIPRSLASMLYGGMQLHCLSAPPVNKKVSSRIIEVAQRLDAVAALSAALTAGKRCVVIYPEINQQDPDVDGQDAAAGEMDAGAGAQTPRNHPAGPAAEGPSRAASVVEATRVFETHFPGRVVALHADMPDDEKIASMAAFRSGERPLAIASTVMETGIDVPDITVMIVRDADRFGAASLHQLRGRLARNGGAALFFMMVDAVGALSPAARDRLTNVCQNNDGFAIAERDMYQRGFGAVDASAQSGPTQTVFRLCGMSARDFMRLRQIGDGLELAGQAPAPAAAHEMAVERSLF